MLKLTQLVVIVLVAGLLISCATTYKIGKQAGMSIVTDLLTGNGLKGQGPTM